MSTPVALVLGGHGLLGQPLAQQLAGNGWEAQSLDFEDCNLLNPVELQPRIEFINPDVIFNTVSWNTENPAEKQPQEALSVNRGLPAFLGGLVKGTSRFLVHYSSDQVFNGRKDSPYTEEDKADPISPCGKSRLAGEQALLELNADNICIIRTGWLFGPDGDSFLKRLLGQAKTEGTVEVIHDQIGSPTYAKDLAQADAAYRKGIELMMQNLLSILAGLKVQPMQSLGKCFNPDYHEAVSHVTDETAAEERIVQVVQTGFTMDEEVLRHAKVVVAN